MRVLVVAQTLDRAESHVLRGLAAQGVELDLVVDPRSLHREVFAPAVRSLTCHAFDRRWDRAGIRVLRELLDGRSHDIAHALTRRALSNSLLATRGRTTQVIAYRGIVGNLSRWDPLARLTWLHPRVARLVCVCEAVRKSLLAVGVAPGRAVTIHKGHDPAWYADLPSASLEHFGVPAGAQVVGCSARMRERKGVDVLLRAVASLQGRIDLHVLLVGQVHDVRLLDLPERLGIARSVHFTGFRTDAAGLMGRCGAFAMPSLRREGLPRAAIEAMAQGVPAVVSDVGGLTELVEDGRSGFVVPAGNIAQMAAALARLFGEPGTRERLGAGARHRIATAFHVDRTVERTWALYRELTTASPSA